MRRLTAALLLSFGLAVTPGQGAFAMNAVMPSLTLYTSTDFSHATLSGVELAGSSARLSADAPTSGGVRMGTLTSGPVTVPGGFTELLPSWNALTPPGSWLELSVRAEVNGRWTKEYSFGRWASGADPARASLNGQGDADGDVLTDVLRLKVPAQRYEYRLRLFGRTANASPEVRLVALTASGAPPASGREANRAAWGKLLNVPARSQMVFKEGEGWCSPTSLSMVLAYWGKSVSVPQAAAGTFDSVYDGTGNWAFNAAYAASLGLTAYATRFTGLAQVERAILSGVPVVLSIGWKEGELPGAPIARSSGHLIVAVGFDAHGDVVVNDPAGASDAEVRRTYPRAALERLWLTHSGGTVYLLYPPGHAL